MKVSDLGEFGLIDLLADILKNTASRQDLIIGISDDAAAWRNSSAITLASTDSLIEGVHFTHDTTGWRDLGWKALAVSLSDIASMGGVPQYALVSLAIPGDAEADNIAELYRGIAEAAERFGVAVCGGDTDSSPVTSINTTVFGAASGQEGSLLTRSSAKINDCIAVTGWLGGAAGGLKMLTDKISLDENNAISLKQSFCRPFPRVTEGQALSKMGVKAAIDISDGLLADLGHICQKSSVGAVIDIDSIPVHPSLKTCFADGALDMALGGGEDYELLFTASDKIMREVKKTASCPITVIGRVTGESGNIRVLDKKGKPYTPTDAGWRHFRQ